MAVMQSSVKRSTVLAWLLTAVLAIFSLGCSGSASEVATPDEIIAQIQAELPALPQDQPGDRQAAELQSELQLGEAAVAKSPGALIESPQMVLPASVLELQWAYYGFNVGTAAALIDIQVHFTMDTGTQAWVGLSNYGKNHWDILGPYGATEDVNLNTGENYISPGGNFYIVVAAYNINTVRLQELFLTYNDGNNLYHIAGTVLDDAAQPIDGASVTIVPGDIIAMCNAAGAYVVSNLVPGAYEVTPNADGYAFDPPSQTVPLLNADIDNVDFVGTLVGDTYAINGSVLDDMAAAIPGSSVTVNPGALVFNCDGAGNYHASGLVPGSYVVTPIAAGYTFVPAFANIDVTNADVNNVNFTGTAPVVVTYVDDARPFLVANCASCHGPNQPLFQDFSPESYDSSVGKLAQIKAKVQADHNGPYSAQDKAMIAAWVDGGGVLGANATHYTDVRSQIFSTICMNCHDSSKSGAARNGAPVDVNFDTYAAATGWRSTNQQISIRANTRVQAGTMPPSGALSPALQELMQKWIDSGWPN